MQRGLIAIAALAAIAFVAVAARIHSAGKTSGQVAATAGTAPGHRSAARLIEHGSLEQRLRRQHGRPVVINAWASWCAPCREEMPLLGAAADAHRGEIAFLGADVDDDAGAARELLASTPVGYPSYPVSSDELAQLVPIHGTPTTIFLSSSGEVAGVHIGAYDSAQQLNADLARYAGA